MQTRAQNLYFQDHFRPSFQVRHQCHYWHCSTVEGQRSGPARSTGVQFDHILVDRTEFQLLLIRSFKLFRQTWFNRARGLSWTLMYNVWYRLYTISLSCNYNVWLEWVGGAVVRSYAALYRSTAVLCTALLSRSGLTPSL